MKWNLRLVAANRGIWKASDLQRRLAEYGLDLSRYKADDLWARQPTSVKLSDLDVICVALDCRVGDLLTPEPERVSRLAPPPSTPPGGSTGSPSQYPYAN